MEFNLDNSWTTYDLGPNKYPEEGRFYCYSFYTSHLYSFVPSSDHDVLHETPEVP